MISVESRPAADLFAVIPAEAGIHFDLAFESNMDSGFRRNDEHGELGFGADRDSAWIGCRLPGLVNPDVEFSTLIGLERAPIDTGLRPWSWRQVHLSSPSITHQVHPYEESASLPAI